jgi:hypothetical protein
MNCEFSLLGGPYVTLACDVRSLKSIATHLCVSWAKNATQQHLSLQKFVVFGTEWKRTFHKVLLEKLQATQSLDLLLPRLIFYPRLAEIVHVCCMVWIERDEENALGSGERNQQTGFCETQGRARV